MKGLLVSALIATMFFTFSTIGDSLQQTGQNRMPKNGEEVAILDTSQGRIVVMFFPEVAPNHVANFKKLAKRGFYNGTRFHRVIPGFMIQGGDPNSKDNNPANDGMGGPGYSVNAEFNKYKHVRGILSAARSSDPNSAGSQFFLMHQAAPHLDNQYSIYGKAVVGLDVIDKIVSLPRGQNDNPNDKTKNVLRKVTLAKWPVK